MTNPPADTPPPVSLVVTVAFVLASTIVGWMVGNASASATRQVTASGLTLEIPEAWGVLEATDREVVLTPNGLPGGRHTIVLYLPGTAEAGDDGVAHFLEVTTRSLNHLSVESSADTEATFRYVRLDRNGGPDAIMAGRFIRFDGMAAALFAPKDGFGSSSEVFDGLVATLEVEGS